MNPLNATTTIFGLIALASRAGFHQISFGLFYDGIRRIEAKYPLLFADAKTDPQEPLGIKELVTTLEVVLRFADLTLDTFVLHVGLSEEAIETGLEHFSRDLGISDFLGLLSAPARDFQVFLSEAKDASFSSENLVSLTS